MIVLPRPVGVCLHGPLSSNVRPRRNTPLDVSAPRRFKATRCALRQVSSSLRGRQSVQRPLELPSKHFSRRRDRLAAVRMEQKKPRFGGLGSARVLRHSRNPRGARRNEGTAALRSRLVAVRAALHQARVQLPRQPQAAPARSLCTLQAAAGLQVMSRGGQSCVSR